MLNDRWTRVLAMALVLPLAGACAETGDDEIDETETLETTPTTEMNRVELEPFGTSDVEGWVTSRTEGDEVILSLNLDQARTGAQAPGDVGAEGEMGTEGEMDAENRSARLIEGMCMDVQPESQRPAAPTGEAAEQETERESAEVETVADFEESDAQRGLDAEAGADARTTPSSGHTLEARVQLSEITGYSYAVVVEENDNEDAVACADVTQLVMNAGSPATGSRDQPAGTPGTGTDEIEDESGSNY